MTDYYGILGVHREATADDIRAAYRRLVKDFHPDVVIGKGLNPAFAEFAATRFVEVQAAYEILHDPAARRAYDRGAGRPAAKELILDLGNSVTMKLVLIPAGRFTMGSPEDEEGRGDQEGPQHEVTISKPFYMGLYTVTQEQYEQVMGKNPSYFKGAQNPVEQVSWDDAVEFCKALSKKTGKTVALPTEAQWEYACRAGTKTRFGFGDDDGDLGDYAWYDKNSDNKTHPVGQKKPNAWGVYDMHGNVFQWCSDWYDEDHYSANGNERDPQGPGSGTARVLRGGCWHVIPMLCRSARRGWYGPGGQGDLLGFRAVVDSR